jgi:uncharacterized membrane protein
MAGAARHVGRATWLPASGCFGTVAGSALTWRMVTIAVLPMTCLVIAIIQGFLQC